MTLLDQIFGLINQTWVPVFLSAAIIIVAFVMFAELRKRLKKVSTDLTSAIKAIQDYRESKLGFEELSSNLEALHYFSPSWNSLRQTLIIEKDELDGTAIVTMPQRVSLHINEPSILGNGINLRFYQALPNMLVGAGLFFTFIGLVMALYFASQGVDQAHDKAVEALKKLLDAATFKFLTSLAGLGSSLFFSWREKAVFHDISMEINQVRTQLELAFKQTSLEGLAVEGNRLMRHQRALLKEQLEEARQQTAQIKRFETDFAVSIASALDNKLTPRFEYVASTLSAAIEHLASKIGTVNEDALRRMIEDFRNTLSEGAGTEVNKLGELVNELTQSITASGTMLGENLKSAGEHITGGAEILEDVLVNLKADVVDLENVVRMATENAEKTTGLLSQNVAELSDLHSSLGRTLDGLNEVGTTIDSTAKTLDNSIQDMVQSQRLTSSQVEQMLKSANTAVEALGKSGDQVTQVASALQAAWRSYQERFESVDEDLESVFTTINDGLHNYTNRVAAFQQQIDSDLGKAVKSLGGLVSELNELVEELIERPSNDNN